MEFGDRFSAVAALCEFYQYEAVFSNPITATSE
jgi:hypothetical protein